MLTVQDLEFSDTCLNDVGPNERVGIYPKP